MNDIDVAPDITLDDVKALGILKRRIHNHAEALVSKMPHEVESYGNYNPSIMSVGLNEPAQMVEVYFKHYDEQSQTFEGTESVDIPYDDFFSAAVMRPIKITNLLTNS